jgi:mannose-6-phosphate isomerase-like protein (cupin superfamily)
MSEPYVLNGRHRGRRATGQAQGSSLALMTLALDYHCHRTRHHWIRSTSKEDRIDEKVNLAEKLSPFAEHWRPKIVARINENDVRIVKVKGEFVWQKHEDTDDFFLVLEGDRNEKDRRS